MSSASTTDEKERRFITLQQKTMKSQKFEFPSYELALQVREVVYIKLIEFDENHDQQFQEEEIRQFLVKVLHENQQEIHYFVKNVFRYDYNNDGIIEYDELVNFCMEQHFGEIAIQRLHRKKLYQKGAQRIMNFSEFEQTIKHALSFIDFTPQEGEIKECFGAVDIDQDGYISYQDYFRFLKEYFGSKSVAAKLVHKKSVIEELKQSGNPKGGLSILKRYSKYDAMAVVKITPEVQPKGSSNTINNSNTLNISNNNRTEPQKPESRINIADISNLLASQYTDSPVNPNANTNTNVNANSLNINFTKNTLNYSSATNQSSAINDKRHKSSGLELNMVNNNKAKKEISLTEAQTILAERIAKLVYIQVKAALIYYDHDLDCSLTLDNLRLFIRRTMPGDDQFGAEIAKRYQLNSEKLYSYDEATKAIINEHICRVFRGTEERQVDQRDFVELSQKICSVAKNTPLKFKYENLFQSKNSGSMTRAEIQQLYTFIFEFYPKCQ